MSRLKNFARSVLSGYILIGANTLYSLVSVPVALHYLDSERFALWALSLQIAGYIALVDLGMTGAVSRILIDHKDGRTDGSYGGIIKTGLWVGIVQGLIILVVGGALTWPAVFLLEVPPELRASFRWLLLGQVVLLALSFATRVLNNLLVAHQRYDITNYGQSLLFGVSLVVMWAAFARGWGVLSFLAAQTVLIVFGILVNLYGCLRLRLFPEAGQWGQVTWVRFKELFAYGQDVFLYAVGLQFINASQTILLTKFTGLNAVTIWSVCTRAYTMITMLIWRLQDYSGPALAEMIVRGERSFLLKRFKDLAVTCASLSVTAGVLLALCNGPFVFVWAHGENYWSVTDDVLVAVWLVVGTVMRMHVFLAGATKQFGLMRFIFFVEGLLFVGLNLLSRQQWGITGMIAFSIVCTLLFSLPYGLWRAREQFQLSWRALAAWYLPTWQLFWRLVPVALATGWLVRNLAPVWQLIVSGLICGSWGAFAFVRYGLSEPLQKDISMKLPAPLRRFFLRAAGFDVHASPVARS